MHQPSLANNSKASVNNRTLERILNPISYSNDSPRQLKTIPSLCIFQADLPSYLTEPILYSNLSRSYTGIIHTFKEAKYKDMIGF